MSPLVLLLAFHGAAFVALLLFSRFSCVLVDEAGRPMPPPEADWEPTWQEATVPAPAPGLETSS